MHFTFLTDFKNKIKRYNSKSKTKSENQSTQDDIKVQN